MKRLSPGILIIIGVILLFGVGLWLASSGSRRYRADSMVVARPYTNTLLSRSFEAQVIRTLPGVLRLEMMPTSTFAPGSTPPALPNAVGIRIIAVGTTPQDAQRAANQAAAQLSRSVLTNYGVSGDVTDAATRARSYSYFHDSFQPGLARLFGH